ncbi:L10-interacting MYB domain-containing protein-like [Neltuma alba]|uniref:L10-interacting MYB domain-containing protein-like n=1 Tax=Neltuma alba TaxID=207710 RepID=UPI0010A3E579|nr:L10-interacting MYB domain-containing protein-like [Prosopis alba]
MDNDNGKVTWDPYTTKILIDVCVEQIVHKERQRTSFKRPGWGKIEKNFQERSRRKYDSRQLKNKFDMLRKDWKLWDKLISGETGIGYAVATNRVLASDEWLTLTSRNLDIRVDVCIRSTENNQRCCGFGRLYVCTISLTAPVDTCDIG